MEITVTYREQLEDGKHRREAYLDEVQQLIRNREIAAAQHRQEHCTDIFENQEKYREAFKQMLGWPLTEPKNPELPKARWETLKQESWGTVSRVSFEVLEGLHITGLMFQKGNEKKPLVLAQHGAATVVEIPANFFGDTCNYNDMIERVLQYDVHVFAPQLLLWSPEGHLVPFNRQDLDARLKRVGSSITAVEIYGLTKILDYFEAQDYVGNFGMVGLSYGGFYTLFTTAIETRIRSAICCAYFTRDAYKWSDWTWFRAAEKFSDAEVACMIYPRRLGVAMGDVDPAFSIENAREEWESLQELCRSVGTEWVNWIEFAGSHEFVKDDAPIRQLIQDIQ